MFPSLCGSVTQILVHSDSPLHAGERQRRRDGERIEESEREMSKDGGRFGGKSEGNKDTGEG